MDFPEFIQNFPDLDVPFPSDVVSCKAIRSDAGLVVFFTFHQDFVIPPHSHLAQWGIAVSGQVEMTINGETKTLGAGEAWDIPENVEHSVKIKSGTTAIDVFQEPDRYPIKS